MNRAKRSGNFWRNAILLLPILAICSCSSLVNPPNDPNDPSIDTSSSKPTAEQKARMLASKALSEAKRKAESEAKALEKKIQERAELLAKEMAAKELQKREEALKAKELTARVEQKEAEVGIETAESEDLDKITLRRIIYVGECPGVSDQQTEGYFVDYSVPTQEGYRVKLVNYARGLSPQKPPFTDRSYESGRASDKIAFQIGTKHKSSYFAVRKGINPIKYQVTDEEDIVQSSGTFTLTANIISYKQRRDKVWGEYSKEYYCP